MKSNFFISLKNNYTILVKLYLLFLISFAALRLLFISFYFSRLQNTEAPLSEIFYAFIAAIPLDIAATSIILSIVWLFMVLISIFKSRLLHILLHLYVVFMGIVIFFIGLIEIGIYKEWEEKPTYKILTYLKHPQEAIHSAPLFDLSILILFLLLFTSLFYKTSKAILSSSLYESQRSWLSIVVFFLLTPGLILLGARGGTSRMPISQSDVYYSSHKILNDIAINSSYNFFHSITENQKIISGKNPYKSGDSKESIYKALHPYLNHECNTSTHFLSNSRPNIMLIILEGIPGEFIGSEKKYRDVMPNMQKLAQEGITFTNTIGSGTLSHEGLPAILSAQPAIYDFYITNLPSKFNKLPSITEVLKEHGYSSLFLFGGQLGYGNLTSYIYKNKFDTIIENKDISGLKHEGSLGYHDEDMFKLLSQMSDNSQEPFFNILYTLSSHTPYDQPYEGNVTWGGDDKKFLNSVEYTDKTIGDFLESVKNKPWYKDTLFIFISDHSHQIPKRYSRNTPQWHKIIMLFFGEPIKEQYRGIRVDKVVSQHDFASTLLAQMDINNSAFTYSRNIFCDDYKEGSYYITVNGYGFTSDQGAYAFGGNSKKKELYNTLKDKNSSIPKIGWYYLEHLFDDVLDK